MNGDVLIDAGPLVALLDRSDDWHQICVATLRTLNSRLITIWPALAEASYLLRASLQAQSRLLNWILDGRIKLALLDRDDIPRMRELMVKYHDLPMDLADAAIVRVAERERIHRVFTVDQKDFNIYRPAHLRRFTLLPPMISPA
jgi:predicted nucleic acid-binding protein